MHEHEQHSARSQQIDATGGISLAVGIQNSRLIRGEARAVTPLIKSRTDTPLIIKQDSWRSTMFLPAGWTK
jgi:hypothetical protein